MDKYCRIITEPYSSKVKPIENPAYKFSFECDSFQNHSFYHISKGENVLVTAHTGSGKTAVAKYAIAHYLRLGKRVVYTSPIKALSNQKYKELIEDFGEDTIGLMTGDNKIKPDARVVIMTTEILRNALYDIGKSEKIQKEVHFEDNFIDSIGCVIFDEVHYINDKSRGRVWEETIILLNPEISLVMLSATIDKAEQFAQWIGNSKKKMVNLIPTTHRVIPLEHYIYTDKKLFRIQDRSDKFYDEDFDSAQKIEKSVQQSRKKPSKLYLINELVEYMVKKDLLQSIFFAFSRKNCEKYAKMISQELISFQERAEINRLFNKYMHTYEKDYAHVSQYQTVKNLMLKGIAYHHSGLLPILKEIIEIVFQKGLIKVLFATETFAVGVNMPTRTIVFTEIEKYTSDTSGSGGRRMLETGEYKQMSGRAGRRGLDKNGTVIILPLYDFPTKQSMKAMMLGKVPHIESKFYVDYQFILKIIQSNSKNIDQFIDASLYQVDNNKIVASQRHASDRLQGQLDLAEAKVDKSRLNVFEKYDKFDKLEREYTKIGVKFTNRQMKDRRKLMGQLSKDNNLKEAYQHYCQYNELKEQMDRANYQIYANQNYVNDFSSQIISFLEEFGYIKESVDINSLNMDNVTMKGILAAQINECNALILTEMITNNMFNDLEAEEIIALLAMFIHDAKFDDKMTIVDVQSSTVPNVVIGKLRDVEKIVDQFVDKETSLQIYNAEEDYWLVSYDYVHIAYMWATGESLGHVMSMVDTYEGNFIKNILKINNIAHDLACLSHIYGNLKIIPQLEQVEDKLVRDIVTVNSLYLK